MSARLTECRKFAPNIFNKSKCTNCFRQREEHTAEALESNRATRKVSKCGYLFVAPDWDFTNPLYRSKRWQRRWFVLYDDGELSYSVDEHPDTVPQASIDMNAVLEVASADDVTGNAYSLAVTAPDRVHFVKAACREEARWWIDVLAVFPRSKGRHKRNATFPGGQSSATTTTSAINARAINAIATTRPRHNSCHSEAPGGIAASRANLWSADQASSNGQQQQQLQQSQQSCKSVNSPAGPHAPTIVSAHAKIPDNNSPSSPRSPYDDQPMSSASPPTRDKMHSEDKARTRREKRSSRFPARHHELKTAQDTTDGINLSHHLLLDEIEQQTKRDEKLKDIVATLTSPRSWRITGSNKISSQSERSNARIPQDTPTRDEGPEDIQNIDLGKNSSEKKNLFTTSKSPTKRESISHKDHIEELAAEGHDRQIRGDPDGGLDISSCYSSNAELRVELPSEDLLNIKKGWLMKHCRAVGQEWSKYWFVLRGAALMFYRDPTAEDKRIMDGVIDINGVTNVTEMQVARNYGFQMTCWDNRRIILSAVTAGIRASWMAAIRKTANLPDLPSCADPDPSVVIGEIVEKELGTNSNNQNITLIKIHSNNNSPLSSLTSQSTSLTSPSSQMSPTDRDNVFSTPTSHMPLVPRSMMFSSDEEYRTASEGGRRDSVDWNDPLPPSPPLNRTAISRVKDRARSRSSSRSRSYKRSRSSPPSSRRSTLDSIQPEDLIIPCDIIEEGIPTESKVVKMLELEVKGLKDQLEDRNCGRKYISDHSPNVELEELKKKLALSQCDLRDAEDELVKLKSFKNESLIREKQMQELLLTLERTERELNKCLQESEDIRSLKEMYRYDKNAWESSVLESEKNLKETTQRCEILAKECSKNQSIIKELQVEIDTLNERLARGIEENDVLYKRLRDLDGRSSSLSSSRERGRSMDSLSDLTNIDLDIDLFQMNKERIIEEYDELRGRFEKAILEIRAMKRELRESHTMYDGLEITNIGLKNDLKRLEDNNQSQINLMAARIQDLTQKLSASEKYTRTLKQKLQKTESRDKRRSLSLKGRDSFAIGKEVEEKLSELEHKIIALECNGNSNSVSEILVNKTSPEILKPKKEISSEDKLLNRASSRVRRKSLDSATNSEPMQVLLRLSSLESKVNSAAELQAPTHIVTSSSIDSLNMISENSESDSISISDSKKHLIERLQSLENVIITSKDKVSQCLDQLLNLKASRTRRSVSPLSDRKDALRYIEKCLSDVNRILKESCDNCIVKTSSDHISKMLFKLENQLKEKLHEILQKRNRLKASLQWNKTKELELLAEKTAFEIVYINQIHEAIQGESNQKFSDKLLNFEIVETSHAIIELKSKLSEKFTKGSKKTISATDVLANVLSKKLILQGVVCDIMSSATTTSLSSPTHSTELQFLKKQQKEIEFAVRKFKEKKLDALARILVIGISYDTTVTEITDLNTHYSRLPGQHMDSAWQIAKDIVNSELIKNEISQVMMCCAQTYQSSIASDFNQRVSFIKSQQVQLENWSDSAQQMLEQEIDLAIKQLNNSFQVMLTELHQKKDLNVDKIKNSDESLKLIAELADVIAHKSLIDSRIKLLTENYNPSHCKSLGSSLNIGKLLEYENMFNMLTEDLNINPIDLELQADLSLLKQYCKNITFSRNDNDSFKYVTKCFLDLEKIIIKMQHNLRINNNKEGPSDFVDLKFITDWEGVFKKCDEFQTRLESLSLCLQGQNCEECRQKQETVQRLTFEHEKQLTQLQKQHKEELETLQATLTKQYKEEQEKLRSEHNQLKLIVSQQEKDRNSLTQQYEIVQSELKERARKLERRLGTLDSEYSQQLENLRAAYHKTVGAGLERDIDCEENLRQRYQAEIEQLRTLCEKGLVAMESSHRRIIAELEEKHRAECEQLAADKEQALNEETQATLAALDAMRKAHQSEVQREITKFKQEFIKQIRANGDMGAQVQQVELEEIRKEILSLSEKYSSKCVESASLEEKLCSTNKQLAQAQQHIMQLDSRNKQLRAHLVSEASEFSPIQLLQPSDEHNPVLDKCHVQRIEGQSRTKSSPKATLNNKADEAQGSHANAQNKSSDRLYKGLNKSPIRCSPALISSVAYATRQSASPPCPLVGMVAERKKRFQL